MPPSFLLRVPLCVDPKLRTFWNSIGFAIQSLKVSYAHLTQTAPVIVDADPEDWPLEYHIAMFSYAWSMVDQIYSICSIARKMTYKKDTPFARFVEGNGPACMARNHLDHLGDRIDNFVRRKSESPPLFGSLSFHHLKEQDLHPDLVLRGFDLITMMSLMNDKVSVQQIAHNRQHEYHVEYPNGCFELQVEGVIVGLSKAYLDAIAVEEYFNNVVKPKIEREIREAAIREGFDPELALSQTTSLGIVFRASVVIGNASESPPV